MKSHQTKLSSATSERVRHDIASGQALTLGPQPGELTVVRGRVWLTRSGDLGDHVLEPGRSVRLGADEGAVVEAWEFGRPVTIDWSRVRQPPRLTDFVPGFLASGVAAALRGLAALAGASAAGLRGAEAGLAALARSAAPSAMRAQGCISGGDSMASSGALK